MLHCTDTPASDLRNAALVIEQGWTRGAMVNEHNGGVCALGAIRLATGTRLVREGAGHCLVCDAHRPFRLIGGDRGRYGPAVRALAEALPRRGRFSGNAETDVADYNDTLGFLGPAGTRHVADLMRAAAARWESEHAREAGSVRPIFGVRRGDAPITAAEFYKMIACETAVITAAELPARKELALAGGPAA